MGSVWFLVLFSLVATSSLAIISQEDETVKKDLSTGIHLEVFHHEKRHTLAQYEARVKTLYSKLATKEDGTTTASTSSDSQSQAELESLGVPVTSGEPLNTANYIVKLGIGTPPKYYSLLIDTGSSFPWLQCLPCLKQCYTQAEPLFNPSTSTTYQTLSCTTPECSIVQNITGNATLCDTFSNTCSYRQAYADGSVYSQGYLSQDVLTLTSSETISNFVFGCGQEQIGFHELDAGIVGLGRDNVSLLGQLAPKYGYDFAYCLPTSGGQGGFLSFGSSSLGDLSAYDFTTLFQDARAPSYYLINLTSITVDGNPLGVSADTYKFGTILDNGAPVTLLPTSLYNVLRDTFVAIMSKTYTRAPNIAGLEACFYGNLNTITGVPEIQLLFLQGTGLTLGTSNILKEVTTGIVCLAFTPTFNNLPLGIIGNYQYKTYKVVFDISNSRVGFASGGCT
ncbi:hypothetical protein UlMin_011086 [Ulmus minor]